MRSLVALALILFAGCEPPAGIRPHAELQFSSQITGARLPAEGGRLQLDSVSNGCSRQLSFFVKNVGLRRATLQVSTSSAEVEVLSAPQSLAPAEEREIELMFKAIESLESTRPATLSFDLEGEEPQQLEVFAPVLTAEWVLPRRLDFGGVELGATRTIGTVSVTELTGDFVQTDGGELQFSPGAPGFQRLDTQYAHLLHCPFISHVTLLGDGVASVLEGPAEVDFGDVQIGASVERDVVVTNSSFDWLRTEVAAPFTLMSATTPDVATRRSLELIPGTSTLRIRFAPSSPGAITRELSVTAGARTLLIPLRGVGVP